MDLHQWPIVEEAGLVIVQQELGNFFGIHPDQSRRMLWEVTEVDIVFVNHSVWVSNVFELGLLVVVLEFLDDLVKVREQVDRVNRLDLISLLVKTDQVEGLTLGKTRLRKGVHDHLLPVLLIVLHGEVDRHRHTGSFVWCLFRKKRVVGWLVLILTLCEKLNQFFFCLRVHTTKKNKKKK